MPERTLWIITISASHTESGQYFVLYNTLTGFYEAVKVNFCTSAFNGCETGKRLHRSC